MYTYLFILNFALEKYTPKLVFDNKGTLHCLFKLLSQPSSPLPPPLNLTSHPINLSTTLLPKLIKFKRLFSPVPTTAFFLLTLPPPQLNPFSLTTARSRFSYSLTLENSLPSCSPSLPSYTCTSVCSSYSSRVSL